MTNQAQIDAQKVLSWISNLHSSEGPIDAEVAVENLRKLDRLPAVDAVLCHMVGTQLAARQVELVRREQIIHSTGPQEVPPRHAANNGDIAARKATSDADEHYAKQPRVFSGNDGISCKALGKGAISRYRIQGKFSIDRSEIANLQFKFNQEWPPMPFASNIVAVYLVNPNLIRIKVSEHMIDIPFISGEKYNLDVECDATPAGARFQISTPDGKVHLESQKWLLDRAFEIGRGYLDRGWWGAVDLLRVSELVSSSSSSEAAPKWTTVLEFDGREVQTGSLVE